MSPNRGRGLTRAQLALLDAIEQAVRSIRHPVESAELFHLQCQYALHQAGLNATMEVLMSRLRRIDIVVVRGGQVAALELERDSVPEPTMAKFRDLPNEVLRVAVLRLWPYRAPVLKNVDRVIGLTSSLACVRWLCEGTAILEEVAGQPLTVRPFSAQVMATRAAEAADARRLVLGARKGPKSVGARQLRLPKLG